MIIGVELNKVLAENYDYNFDHGVIVVNLKGTIKENGRLPGEKSIRWTVKYGSISFNQFSLELPVSGMNEKGLAVALMWHDDGDFGDDDKYVRLSGLQWIQYQLDNYQNIAEVMHGLETLRPKKEAIPLHYIILDANGECLMVEFIDGILHLRRNPDVPVLTNSSYGNSVEFAASGSSGEVMTGNSSLARFSRLYKKYCETNHDLSNIATGFDWLDSAKQIPEQDQLFPWGEDSQNTTITAWSVLFSPSTRTILLKTARNDSIREIRLKDFCFEKESKYYLLDINEGEGDKINNLFTPYTKEASRNLIHQTARSFQMTIAEQEGLVNIIDDLYRNREIIIMG